MFAEDIKKLQDEKVSLEEENNRLRKQVREIRSIRNVSVNELALSLDRINIDTNSADKHVQFARVIQHRFKVTREELLDRMR
jgi:hypothetical protein